MYNDHVKMLQALFKQNIYYLWKCAVKWTVSVRHIWLSYNTLTNSNHYFPPIPSQPHPHPHTLTPLHTGTHPLYLLPLSTQAHIPSISLPPPPPTRKHTSMHALIHTHTHTHTQTHTQMGRQEFRSRVKLANCTGNRTVLEPVFHTFHCSKTASRWKQFEFIVQCSNFNGPHASSVKDCPVWQK